MSHISEICSCNAQFDYSSRSDIECQIAARKWRKEHIHGPLKLEDTLEPHNTELDAYVERADHRDMNPNAELDHRTRTGF